MRWLLLAILAYACLVLQAWAFSPGGLAAQVHGHWTAPDLALLFGLFIALYFEPPVVFVTGWCLGMASDILPVSGKIGVLALLFCLLLYGVSLLRAVIPRGRVWVQFGLALGIVLVVHGVWYVATRLLEGSDPMVLRSAEEALLDAGYSAVLAPYLFWLLGWLRAPLGIPSGTSSD